MRFSTAVVIAYVAYTSSSALAAPVPSSDAIDTMQYKRDLEARDYRPPFRHGRQRTQSPPPSPVFTEAETTGERQHIEKRRKITPRFKNVSTGKLRPGHSPHRSWLPIPKLGGRRSGRGHRDLNSRLPPTKFGIKVSQFSSFKGPGRRSGSKLMSEVLQTGTVPPIRARIPIPKVRSMIQNPIAKREVQELEAPGRRHKHAQPSPEAAAKAAPEKRSLDMEIDELD